MLAQRDANGTQVLQRLAAPWRDNALAQAATLAQRSRAERANVVGEWLVTVRAPVPPSFRLLHRDWIEAALAHAPVATRAALAGGVATPATTWLARRFCAQFPALPPLLDDTVPLHAPAQVAALRYERLIGLLTAVGAAAVVQALGAAAVAAADAAKLGGNRMVLAAALKRSPASTWPRGLQRRLLEWVSQAQRSTGGLASATMLPAVGAQVVARVAGVVPMQLGYRLPQSLGQPLLHLSPVADEANADNMPWAIVTAAAAC